jgi:hypothetical protein
MKNVGGEFSPTDETESRRKGSWPLSRWLLLIALALAAHIALIFIFGTRKSITPMVVKDAPRLELIAGASEWLRLNDPTLFALPNSQGFAGPVWVEPPRVQFHRQEWSEPPRYLSLSGGELGGIFSRFMETNRFATFNVELKPPPPFTVPLVPLEPKFADASTLHIEGDLVRRSLLTSMKLPRWPYADVLQPSKVQVLVNPAGNVVSTVLLSSSGFATADPHAVTPDQRALELARAARFAPGPDLTLGKLIFNWCTVPPPATNTPAAL